jgi:hypothetical protein
MKFEQLRIKSQDYPLFRYVDILKWFPKDNEQTIKQNLKFWVKKNLLERVTRGVYKLKETKIEDEFLLASYFNENSYISLESALSYYGLIPEYPFAVTSVTTKKTKKIKTGYGLFIYRKIKPELFFGFKLVTGDNYLYRLALAEKAIFDFIYLNQAEIKSPDYFKEMRLSLSDKKLLNKLLPLLTRLKNLKIISHLKSYVNNQ